MGTDRVWPLARFASVEEVHSPQFASLNKVLDEINVTYELADHSDLNLKRYPWSSDMLSAPAFYAARMWEYPFALQSADLYPGMRVADIGCGMTPFTIYLDQQSRCEVTGVDPDLFDAGIKYLGHGVSEEFIEKTGLHVVEGGLEALPLPSNSQDRVFCISVMEHLPPYVRRRGMQEIARVLKPGGQAVLTVDMSMALELNRPLDLVWDSGLTLVEPVDLRWPARRFGMLDGEGPQRLPADVLGMVLLKEDRLVETLYREAASSVRAVPAHLVPTLIHPMPPAPLRWRRIAGRLRARMLGALCGWTHRPRRPNPLAA